MLSKTETKQNKKQSPKSYILYDSIYINIFEMTKV